MKKELSIEHAVLFKNFNKNKSVQLRADKRLRKDWGNWLSIPPSGAVSQFSSGFTNPK